jgi:hypothetical protein
MKVSVKVDLPQIWEMLYPDIQLTAQSIGVAVHMKQVILTFGGEMPNPAPKGCLVIVHNIDRIRSPKKIQIVDTRMIAALERD